MSRIPLASFQHAGALICLSCFLSACHSSRARAKDPSSIAQRSDLSLDTAEALLEAGEGARAVVAFSQLAAEEASGEKVRKQALRGLARAYETVGDFEGARSAYEQLLTEDPRAPDISTNWARRGAVEAELGLWAQSARSFELAYQSLDEDELISYRIEMLARAAYALFSADRLEDCSLVLERAEALYSAELADPTERFSTYYFVGMMRFYRGAIIHRRFRSIEVRLPEARMAKDFEAKLALLTEAQDAYNEAIKVKHVYWVSAAGYQLGTLFEEFYDSLMHAPVPEWLDGGQRESYYEELKSQLRPVVNKAIWVFEKNLESARRIGYENPFVEQTREALGRLQSILLAADSSLGSPHPRLVEPLFQGERTLGADSGENAALGPLDRKLHLPRMTPL